MDQVAQLFTPASLDEVGTLPAAISDLIDEHIDHLIRHFSGQTVFVAGRLEKPTPVDPEQRQLWRTYVANKIKLVLRSHKDLRCGPLFPAGDSLLASAALAAFMNVHVANGLTTMIVDERMLQSKTPNYLHIAERMCTKIRDAGFFPPTIRRDMTVDHLSAFTKIVYDTFSGRRTQAQRSSYVTRKRYREISEKLELLGKSEAALGGDAPVDVGSNRVSMEPIE